MYRINENKLSAVGFQFEIPQGCYIDMKGLEGADEHSIRFLTPEKDMSINLRTENDEYESSMDALKDSFTDFVLKSGSTFELFDDETRPEYKWVEKPVLFENNDMSGSRVSYIGRGRECCRMYFEKIEGYDDYLVICMETYVEGISIKDVMMRPEIKHFFESLKLDK